MRAILREVKHRPWAVPLGRWIMAQTWHDLLFAHWTAPAAMLRPLLPADLELAMFQEQCWVSVVPFWMNGVRLRGAPALPWLSAFAELNVRTYVVSSGKPGVWFFSLDAGNPIAVAIARAWFHLPYFRARMSLREEDGWIVYRSERMHRGAPFAELSCQYRPIDEVFQARPGTLEHFLTERYCLYAVNARGQIFRAEIHHPPWMLQMAEANVERNTMAAAAGIALPADPPLLHFARRQDVVVWGPRRLGE